MISSEVQRTLVKSPPELWAELSDPAALARHLGELGEIRIVRTDPEKTVEWAAENTTGTVSIQPSGWGTKVTLSVTRELTETHCPPESAEAEAADADADAHADADADDSATAPSAEDQPELAAAAEPEVAEETQDEDEATAEPGPMAEPRAAETDPDNTAARHAPEPRRGFFARLFGRRRRELQTADATPAEVPTAAEDPAAEDPSTEQPDAFAAVRDVLTAESFAAVHPFAAPPVATVNPPAEPVQAPEVEQETQAESPGDIAAELMAAEEVAAEEVTAVLAAVLDRLGAAHHRPFSRA